MRNVLVAAALGLPASLPAQNSDSLSLLGQRILAVAFGVSGSREASAGVGQTNARATGTLGSLIYAHFVGPVVAIEVGATVLDAEESVNTGGTRASAVTALLLGLHYAPRQLALTRAIRPFVSGALGAYFHSESQAATGGASTSMQSRVGGRVGAGSSFYVARRVVLRVEGQYHAVQAFDPVNGSAPDPSGMSLALGLGFAWGR